MSYSGLSQSKTTTQESQKQVQVTKAVTLNDNDFCQFIEETTRASHEIIEIIPMLNGLQTVIFKKRVRKPVKQLSVAQVAKHIKELSDDFGGFAFWDVERNEKGQVKISHDKTGEIFYAGSGIGAKRFLNKYKQETMWTAALARYVRL